MKKLFFLAMTAAVLMGCKSNGPGEGERVIDMLPKTRFIELTESQKDFVNKNTDFSFNLFRAINQMPEGQKSNIISSPLFLDSARITSWPSMNSARN